MYVVRLEGGRFHSACKTFEDANNELKFLSNIGITASFKFEDFIEEALESSKAKIKSIKNIGEKFGIFYS